MSHKKNFDYIIVGGGTAGLVVAARLTENPSIRVCVLEAGHDVSQEAEINVPGHLIRNLENPQHQWGFFSEPKAGADDRAIPLPRGKSLGGTSNLNFMMLGRAPSLEYDEFESLGMEGWNSAEFVKYLKKSETLNYPTDITHAMGLTVDPEHHGYDGPIINTLAKVIDPLYPYFVQACAKVGIPFNPDATADLNTGVSPCGNAIDPVTVTRISSATAYYEPIKERDNLVVLTGTHATRILFHQNDNSTELVAQQVRYVRDGIISVVTATREVILCAGSYQTPQLLELSGIGDPEILESHCIEVLVKLPGVGKNLQDHPKVTINVAYNSSPDLQSFDVLQDRTREHEAAIYKKKTAPMNRSALAFVPLKTFTSDCSISDMVSRLKSTNVPLLSSRSLDLQKRWIDSSPQLEVVFASMFTPIPAEPAPIPGKAFFSLHLIMLHPFSRGSCHIGSSDPLAPPVIDVALLDNDIDMEILVSGTKFVRKLCQSEPLRSIIDEDIIAGPQSDEEIKIQLRERTDVCFHPIGTASMLPREEGGVVDSNLKVYGTRNLRVVDASIFPIHMATHPQATIYAMAEKAADIIKSFAN